MTCTLWRRAAYAPVGRTFVASVAAILPLFFLCRPCVAQTPPAPNPPPANPPAAPATNPPATTGGTPAAPGSGDADEEVPPISTERPGFTNGTDIVPLHHIQFEGGYLAASFYGTSTQDIFDSSELRVPITTDSEIRFGVPQYYFQTSDHRELGYGWADSSLSAKVRVLSEITGKQPAVAFILGTTLPTGGPYYRADQLEPGLDVEVQMSVASLFQVQANLSGVRDRAFGQSYTQIATALSLSYSLTPAISPFVQIQRQAADNVIANNATVVDAGVTYALTHSLQLDASAGLGISAEHYSYHSIGAGISKRW